MGKDSGLLVATEFGDGEGKSWGCLSSSGVGVKLFEVVLHLIDK